MNKRRRLPWTDEEINFIITNYGTINAREMQEHLERRTIAAIQTKISHLIKEEKIEGAEINPSWTKEDDEYLIANYGEVDNEIIMKKLNRSLDGIRMRFYKLKDINRVKEQREIRKELERQREQGKMEKIYKRAMGKPKDYGIGKEIPKMKFKTGQTYIVAALTKEGKVNTKENGANFKGKMIGETKDYIILQGRYKECFLKRDFLIKDYEIREVGN